MNLFSVSNIFIILSSLIISVVVLMKGREQKVSLVLGIFCFIVSLWGLGAFGVSIAANKEDALRYWQVGYICCILSPVFYYYFIILFLKIRDTFHRILLYMSGCLAALFLSFDIFAPQYFLGDLRFVFDQFYWTDWLSHKSPLWLTYYVGFNWLLLGYSFYLLIIEYRKSAGTFRNQLKYVIVGSIAGWWGAHSDYLIALHVDIYPYSNIILGIYTVFFAYAIVKHHLMDIKLVFTRASLFIALYTVVLGFPFLIGYHTNSWVMATTSAIIFATIGPLAYRSLERKAEEILMAEQRQYRKVLLQAASGMIREHNLEKLFKLIVYMVRKAVGLEFAAMYLHDRDKKLYKLMAARKIVVPDAMHILSDEHPFSMSIIKKIDPVLFEDLPQDVRETMTFSKPVSLLVPTHDEHEPLAVLILGNKENGKGFSDDDINVFRILSTQAALAIENCMFIEEFKLAQEKIFIAEKLASIGGLAEGVAHQVNNRLNHFSMVSGELKYEIESFRQTNAGLILKNPEIDKTLAYFEKISDSLMENVRRTDGIVKGILNYARVESKETLFSTFFMQEVVDLSIELLKIKHGFSSFPLKFEKSSSDLIYGVKSQIMESVYNILDNCYEATQERALKMSEDELDHYSPLIELSVQQRPASVFIHFSDNGIGIKPENKQKVFAPFFTTKASSKSGTGIGMYVVRRMVEENHHGKIWFESTYGQGTSIFIELPKK